MTRNHFGRRGILPRRALAVAISPTRICRGRRSASPIGIKLRERAIISVGIILSTSNTCYGIESKSSIQRIAMLIEYDRSKFPRSRGAQCGVLCGKARLKPRWGLDAWDIGSLCTFRPSGARGWCAMRTLQMYLSNGL